MTQEEKDLYPSEPFGHCDIGTEIEVCSKCPNFPAKCAYQSKESLKERYKRIVKSNEFKKTIRTNLWKIFHILTITNKKNKGMNKEWKPEDLENLLKINDSFREKCKHIVKIINEIYVEVTGKSEPFCFEDFHIDEQRVFFNVCYADGPLRKNMRSFPCSLLTMNEDSELKREILKLMIVEGVEGDKLSVDELVEIVKNITETRKETEVLDEE